MKFDTFSFRCQRWSDRESERMMELHIWVTSTCKIHINRIRRTLNAFSVILSIWNSSKIVWLIGFHFDEHLELVTHVFHELLNAKWNWACQYIFFLSLSIRMSKLFMFVGSNFTRANNNAHVHSRHLGIVTWKCPGIPRESWNFMFFFISAHTLDSMKFQFARFTEQPSRNSSKLDRFKSSYTRVIGYH